MAKEKVSENYYSLRMLPSRERHSPQGGSIDQMVCDDQNLYCFITNETRKLWKFNFSSGLWAELTVKDVPNVIDKEIGLWEDSMYIYGRDDPKGTRYLYKLYLNSRYLRFIRKKETHQYNDGIGLFIKEKYYYCSPRWGYPIFGERRLEMQIDILDLKLLTESQIGGRKNSYGRFDHSVSNLGNRIYVFGGRSKDGVCDFNSIPFYDLDERYWDVLVTRNNDEYDTPPPANHPSVVSVPGENSFFMFVRENPNDFIYNSVWKLELEIPLWTEMTSLEFFNYLIEPTPMETSDSGMYSAGHRYHSDVGTYRTLQVHNACLTNPRLPGFGIPSTLAERLALCLRKDEMNHSEIRI